MAKAEVAPDETQDKSEVAVAETYAGAFPLYLKVMLGVLGFSAVLLSLIVAYLFRLLKS